MKKIIIAFILGILTFWGQSILAQVEDDSDFWSDFEGWDNKEFMKAIDQPEIHAIWGSASPETHSDLFNGKFANLGMVEIKLGFSHMVEAGKNNEILKYTNSFIKGAFYSSGFAAGSDKSQGDIELSAFSFGVGDSKGYGYSLAKNTSLIFYYGGSLIWTNIDFKDSIPSINDPFHLKDTYHDAIRFGNQFEGGIKFQIAGPFVFNAGYERSIIYTRHMFWYWLGSVAIEGIGQGLLDSFIKSIIKSSPYAGPVVFFILKNGLAYGLYELRKSNMNWPINTAKPLMINSFKLGLSFMF